jgi:hypothetical protein
MNMTTHPEHLLARAADGAALTGEERRELEAHLSACVPCRNALEGQRLVAHALAARAGAAAGAGFAGRVSARLDAEDGSVLDLANWRAWTVGIAPLAAGLVLVAYLGFGASDTAAVSSEAPTFESWASASAGTTPAAVFLQPSSSSDQLLETVLTGAAPATGRESSDVR